MPTLIPAASRAMAVFEVFAQEKRELSNSDMARLLQVAESSTSDLLHTLHSLGYLMRTTRTRRFYPTGRMLETVRQIAENDPLTVAAQEAAEQLGARSDESAFVGVPDPTCVKVVATQPSRLPLRYILDVGARASFHASRWARRCCPCCRKTRLAHLARHALRPLTSHTVLDLDALMAQIAEGRGRGWWESREEGSEGVYGLAVSGWLGDQPVGLSLAGPAERMRKNHEAYLAVLRGVRNALLSDS
ncbi:IclR family transcriptional regulator [Cupriavidus sp. UYMMa02A]|nr:IclR family transcriptional regulator [Cupriavidus sp. UYMMa02A]